MLPIDFNDFSDSPTIILSPHQHQFDPISRAAHSYLHQSFIPIMPIKPWDNRPNSVTSIKANFSRKRSNTTEDLDEARLPPTRTPAISPDAIHGAGMELIDPLTGVAKRAESQTGTWLEGKLEQAFQDDSAEPRSSTLDLPGQSPKRKLLRRDTSTSTGGTDGACDPSGTSLTGVENGDIDLYTQLLGVGWYKVKEDPDVLAATRGCVRYIENHYPLTEVEIISKSKGLDLVLAKSREGWYLFPESLSIGRRIARTWEDTLSNLRALPMRFEGEELVPSRNAAIRPSLALELGSQDISGVGCQMDVD